MLLNLPLFSKYQWHAYSVCSGADDDTINFMVKNNGDFSGFLIYLFKEAHQKKFQESFKEDTPVNKIPKKKKKKLAAVEPHS